MGWISYAKPGSEFGPCLEDCTHVDCEATRQQTKEQCTGCGEAVGYDRPFFNVVIGDPPRSAVTHLRCWYGPKDKGSKQTT